MIALETQRAIALLTPTPTFTPVYITNTPLPSSTPTDIPTVTPVPTTMPVARAVIPEPYYVYLSSDPGGENRLNAFLSNTHIVDVVECVVLEDDDVWLFVMEEEEKISGWVQVRYVELITLEDNLYCHPIDN